MIGHVLVRTLLAQTISANTTGAAVDLLGAAELGTLQIRFRLDVLAVSGISPTLTVTIQQSPDGSTGWTDVVAFPAVSAVGSTERWALVTQRYVRAVATVGGTSPSFNAAVYAIATSEYA